MSGLGAVLGGGRRAEVFALGEAVFKAFSPGTRRAAVEREAAAQRLAAALGAPVPRVRFVGCIAGRLGIAMDRVPGPALGERLMAGRDAPQAGLARMLRLHLALHALPGAGLPGLHPRLAARIGAAPLVAARRGALLAGLAALPPGDRLCHGDFHPFNILGPPGAEQVIDWADAASGAPLADACRTSVLIAPVDAALARAYLDHYVRAAGADPAEAASWLPIVAAARLGEAIPGEEAALRPLAEGARPGG
ncbi:MAG: phosphotransferase [Acetobacteraceae bacterium]|nr:phosphotransferase [Acetobacteraceae bacterium]